MSTISPETRFVAERVFSSPRLRPRDNAARPGDLPPVRLNPDDGTLEHCPADAEGAFEADGRGLHIALLGTGLPSDMSRPLPNMQLYPVGRDDTDDPTQHERFNLALLSQWLPAAHFHVFALRTVTRTDGGIGVSDRHIDEALELCRGLERLDFIIASITPSHHRFLGNTHLFQRGAAAEPVVSFWPTGNWRPGNTPQSRQQIGSVNRNIILAGQALPLFARARTYRVPRSARYDSEHLLPHFWAPGPAPAAGAVGSSYATVPVACAWIKLAQTLNFLRHHRLIEMAPGDLTDFLRQQLRDGRSARRRLLTHGCPGFPRQTRGLINLATAFELATTRLLPAELAPKIMGVFYRRRRRRRRPRLLLGLVATLAAIAGWTYHIDLWPYYAPALDLAYFSGWTYIVAVADPDRVAAWRTGSAAASGTIGLACTWLAAGSASWEE
jgi:hypothetical protein